jgi:hypothetical protein
MPKTSKSICFGQPGIQRADDIFPGWNAIRKNGLEEAVMVDAGGSAARRLLAVAATACVPAVGLPARPSPR